MANFNSVFFLSLLVAISTFMAVPSAVEAQLATFTNINGTVYCAPNVTVSPNGSVTGNPPPLPLAVLQLRCNGTSATAISVTNSNGFFLFLLSQDLYPTLTPQVLVNNCRLVVTTPISIRNCNATLFASLNGSTLASGLQQAIPPTSSFLLGFLRILYFLPTGFRPTP